MSQSRKLYNVFHTEKLEGEKFIWDSMTKGRHPTFTSKRKVVKVKLQDKVVTLKEERILMTRLIITS